MMRTHGAYRGLERALLGGLVGVHVVLAQRLGGPVAAAVVVGAVGALLAVGPVRHRITTALRGARVRRAWDRAVLDAGVATGPFRGPRALALTTVAVGELLRVRVPRGASVAE